MSVQTLAATVSALFAYFFLILAETGVGGIIGPYPGKIAYIEILALQATLSGIFAVGAYTNVLALRRWFGVVFSPPAIDPLETDYVLPGWPEQRDELHLVVGESHKLNLGYSEVPSWYTLPALGLYAGTIVFGSPGSSKTAGMALPYLRQILEFAADDHVRKPGGQLMDYKASLVRPLLSLAAEVGRLDDILLIGPEHNIYWNPIHAPDLEPRVIASRLMAVLENLSGPQGDSGKWIRDNTALMFEHALGIVRLAAGYVTLYDIDRMIFNFNMTLDEYEQDRRDKDQKDKNKLRTSLEDVIDDFFAPLEEQVPEGQQRQFQHHTKWWYKYAGEKPQIRSMYVMELERVLQYFTDPKHRSKYCPPQEKINFFGFRDSCIRDGKIIALDATVEKYGPLANALGIFLKLEFQRNVLARKGEHLSNGLNYARPIFLFIDEYQEFVSAGGNFGDDQFLALSRESKAVNVFLTQGRVSLVSKLGEMRTKVLLNSIRTKVFLGLEDPQDRDYAASTCGQEWQTKESISIGEQVQAAKFTSQWGFVGDNSTVQESRTLQQSNQNRWEPTDFRDLPAFTAIVSGFDGTRSMPPERVYLKPYFEARDVPHKVFMERWTTGGYKK